MAHSPILIEATVLGFVPGETGVAVGANVPGLVFYNPGTPINLLHDFSSRSCPEALIMLFQDSLKS